MKRERFPPHALTYGSAHCLAYSPIENIPACVEKIPLTNALAFYILSRLRILSYGSCRAN